MAEALLARKIEYSPQLLNEINGFDLDLEIAAIKKRRLMGQELLGDTKANVYGWISEYILGLKVFKNQVKLDEKGHLVNSMSGVRLLDITDPREREGKPLQAIADAELDLANGEIGGILVIASPAGGSQDQKGRQIHLKYTQVYAFEKKEEGIIDAVTIVVDNDLDDNRKLLENFGKKKAEIFQGESEYDQICHVAGIVAFLPSERNLHLEGIIEEISRARKENNHPLAEKVKADLLDGVANRENASFKLERANRITALYFDQFEQFVLGNQTQIDEHFKDELQRTLEKIAHEIEFGTREVEKMIQGQLSDLEKRRTYRFLGTRTGCNDQFGGGGLIMVGGPFGDRFGYLDEDDLPQEVRTINGEAHLRLSNGQLVKGRMCFCGFLTACGLDQLQPRCFRKKCRRLLITPQSG